MLILQPTGDMQKPVDNQIDTDGQKGDGARRPKRYKDTEGDRSRIFTHHTAPVRHGGLDAEPQKAERSDK